MTEQERSVGRPPGREPGEGAGKGHGQPPTPPGLSSRAGTGRGWAPKECVFISFDFLKMFFI